MKMDLRLIAIDKHQMEDHGYGEVAKRCSVSKYISKDKRKGPSLHRRHYSTPSCHPIKPPEEQKQKRKSMDSCIGGTIVEQKCGTSKTVWDNMDELELEDEVDDDDVDDEVTIATLGILILYKFTDPKGEVPRHLLLGFWCLHNSASTQFRSRKAAL
ncbi:uncharacterized protein EV154DRAFT_547919 [Mucor mucedo]|uniref:uncharacterized protein n=1 Tax=Mucor mucedo TaxID=29922 RepID=UPI00221F39B8|nr:uncharacterized protein EV154DRAFT_547919 [Mucor mucedo]KAI7895907.1 hypothetical protein EV154DRAFT_547919 [Mucor mucedo]